MRSKLIGQSEEYYLYYEVLRKLNRITQLAPNIQWNITPLVTTTSTTTLGLDNDYQAVLNRATALGYSLPSFDQRLKQNQLVLDLKSAGIWNELDVFYVFATDGDSDYATLNWKSPNSFQCSKVNSPTFTSNQGFTGNGTSSYLNTNFSPSSGVNYVQDDGSIFIYSYTNLNAALQYDAGSGGFSLANASIINTRGFAFRINQSTTSTVTNSNSQGFFQISRTASNLITVYRNGSSIGTDTDVSSGRSTRPIFICAINYDGTPTNYSTRQIGMFSVGSSLSESASDFYTIWNSYLVSL